MRVVEFQSLALGVVLLTHTTLVSAATHTAASCAQRDVEAAVARASPGDTVLIPAGTAAWSNSISLRKGIHLKGAGGGGFIGHSRTAHSISTGSKAFITLAGLDLRVGCRVRAICIANGTRFLEGTVTSYAGTNLVLDVSATGGAGRYGAWVLALPAATTIINHAANDWNRAMIDVFEDAAAKVEISGIRFHSGTARYGAHLNLHRSPGGKPVIVHDCWFTHGGEIGRAILVMNNRGLVYRCSFDGGLEEGVPVLHHTGITLKWLGGESGESWSTPDTLGMRDASGLTNFYVEDCYFAGAQSFDFDDNSRTVVRHCVFNNSNLGSHGAETSPAGMRHFELYDSTFLFDDLDDETLNLNRWLWLRGGTGIVTDNLMPDMKSRMWGDCDEIQMIVMSLRRQCLHAGHAYPVPRQVGQGHDGTGHVLDPLYIWNNPGHPRVGVNDYEPDEVGRNLQTADYLKPGRDYHVGVAKPGYQKFSYPHPLRSAGPGREAVAGDPLRFELRAVDAAGPANPWTKIAGDLDGDGRDELIVGGQKGPLVWYRWPDFNKHSIADSGWNTVSGAVGDVDGDGDLDVLMGGTVWFENPGQLRSSPERVWTRHAIADDPTHDLAAADFNGDGRLDAVTRNQSEFGAQSGNRIRVWLQQPEQRWQGVELSCPHGEGLAVADLDRDSDPDIVIGGTWFETIREVGQVRWQAHGFAEFHRNATVAVADFNGDGRPDVALAPSELAGQRDRLSWFEAPANPRAPSWREHPLIDPIEAVVHSLAAADFDRDVRMDIAFAEMHQGADPDEVGVLLNRGSDHPWEKVIVSTTGSHGLQVLDVDGAPDLFGANWSGPLQTIQWWHNLAGSSGRASAGGATPAGEAQKVPRAQSIAWPLKVSRDGRYLVDQNEQPFLLIGDSPWSLIVEPTSAQAERYLDDRKAKGFNALLVNLLEHKFSTQPPKLRDGTPPFTTPGDFDTLNEAYFRYAEQIVRQAGERGLAVLLCPAYLGYGGGDDGFFQEMLRSGPQKIRAYGRAIGRRFRSHPNVIWVVGGDFTPPPEQRWTVDELAAGLKEEDPAHLMTVHYGPNTAAVAIYGDRVWLQLNSVYDYREDLYVPCLEQDARSPRLPYFLFETAYEGEHQASAARIRRQAYWPLLGGAFGVLYGNSPVWHFGSRGVYDRGGDWVAALDSRGARDMARLVPAFRERPWWRLRPDREPRLVIAGGGTVGQLDYVTAARSEDGTLGLAYVPSTGTDRRELTLDLRLFKGPVTARWFNPTDGRHTAIAGSPFDNRQPQRLTTPGDNGTGDNDWLLILDCLGE